MAVGVAEQSVVPEALRADLPEPASRPYGLWANGMAMTPEEFDTATDWDRDYRYELVQGVLVVSPPPDISERRPNDELGHWLLTYQSDHPQGRVIDDTVGEETVCTAAGRRRMDRAVWIGLGRPPRPLKDVPAIAVEFVSDSARSRRRDYRDKRLEYQQAGVREYWVIDRFRRCLTVFRGEDVIVVPEGETYRTDLLPGFELPLARLLQMADRYTSPG
jgi:Uma2 family endonuclease